jgi:hypothetical protein
MAAEVRPVSSISFWQQDQNWRIQQQNRTQDLSISGAVGSVMMSALTNQTTGLASIANQRALVRAQTALSAALKSAIAQTSGSSSGASSGSATSGSLLNLFA